ncbi:MAG: alkaline phosphatase family protein [Chloroflexota bacterium]
MAIHAEKVMVLGIDAPIVPRLRKYALEGKLPALQRLFQEGTHAPNCLVPFPTITPPNWTTITTGAWPGTHGITDFEGHIPGDPLDKLHQNFDSTEVLAERIWEAAARVGKKTILVNYPTSYKANVGPDGIVVAGYGLNVNDWRYGMDKKTNQLNNLSHDLMLTTTPYPFATDVELKKASGWQGVEHGPRALDASVTLNARRSLRQVEAWQWHLLVDAAAGSAYDTVTVATAKEKGAVIARLKVGEWSSNIQATFQTDAGPKRAAFRMKLLELSPDGQVMRLYVPGICSLEDWAAPKSVEQEIVSEEGLPTMRGAWDSFLMEWIDAPTLVEVTDLMHNFLADAGTYLLKNKPWDLYFMHIHTPDWMHHTISVDLDPHTAQHPEQIPQFEWLEQQLYMGVDRAVGRILECADEKTLVVVVSDHGAKPKGQDFNVNEILEAAGLLVYETSQEQAAGAQAWYLPTDSQKAREVDWTKTKAIGQRRVHVYVNVKGRDPQGIVAPGEEFERVQEQIIKALYEWNDPRSGDKPIALALKNQDARVLGQFGPRTGDVIFAITPRFGREHGEQLPTATWGVGDIHGLFIMKGPGVKQGAEIERTVYLADITPTICHLTELPIPAQAEGSILYQALEDPDAQVKEIQSLRRNVDRLKRMVERPPMC